MIGHSGGRASSRCAISPYLTKRVIISPRHDLLSPSLAFSRLLSRSGWASVGQGLIWYELFVRLAPADTDTPAQPDTPGQPDTGGQPDTAGQPGTAAGTRGTRGQLGAYSRWSTSHKISHEWGGADKPWEPLRNVRQSDLSVLAQRLRYLSSIDLSAGGGNGTGASTCASMLWRLRRCMPREAQSAVTITCPSLHVHPHGRLHVFR